MLRIRCDRPRSFTLFTHLMVLLCALYLCSAASAADKHTSSSAAKPAASAAKPSGGGAAAGHAAGAAGHPGAVNAGKAGTPAGSVGHPGGAPGAAAHPGGTGGAAGRPGAPGGAGHVGGTPGGMGHPGGAGAMDIQVDPAVWDILAEPALTPAGWAQPAARQGAAPCIPRAGKRYGCAPTGARPSYTIRGAG